MPMNLWKQISSCLEADRGRRKVLQKVKKKFLGLVGKFIILIVAIISQMYLYIKNYLIVHFKYVLFNCMPIILQ